jgi:hypothetical protein
LNLQAQILVFEIVSADLLAFKNLRRLSEKPIDSPFQQDDPLFQAQESVTERPNSPSRVETPDGDRYIDQDNGKPHRFFSVQLIKIIGDRWVSFNRKFSD